MNEIQLLDSLRNKVSNEIDIEAEGLGRYVVYTPFMFDDGDHYVVILRNENGRWLLSDEGHTFMHLSYEGVDPQKGTRGRIIDETLLVHGVEFVDGELRLVVPDEDFGNALFSFIQALARTSTVAQMTKEKVATSFYEDLREFINEIVPENRIAWDWHDTERDPEGIYTVDCKINGIGTPWFVFGVHSTDKCHNASITCLMYERMMLRFNSIVVFEDQRDINRKALAQLSDVVGKQFSSLGDRSRIRKYFQDEVLITANHN